MEQTLKITNVLADPTRYYIYQYITEQHREVTVQEIAGQFGIHPNVARLHLSKLEDVSMLVSDTKKSGTGGGRPSRLYRLSDEVIQLHFPYRDYQLLAKIAFESMASLGEPGRQALFATGKGFGTELMARAAGSASTFEEKLVILKQAAILAGFSPEFEGDPEKGEVRFSIFNCPFKEIAREDPDMVCRMHHAFLTGMFEAVFEDVKLVEKENMTNGCRSCSYHAVTR